MRLIPSIHDFLVLPKSKSSKILGSLCNFNLRLLFLIPFRCRNFLISRIVVILSKFYRACAWHENSSSPRWRRGRALLMSEPRGARETSSRSLSLVNTGTQHCFWCKISAGETCLSLLVYDPAHHPPPARQKQWKNECSADAIGPPWVVHPGWKFGSRHAIQSTVRDLRSVLGVRGFLDRFLMVFCWL